MNSILSGGHYQLYYCTLRGTKSKFISSSTKMQDIPEDVGYSIAGADQIQCPMKIR